MSVYTHRCRKNIIPANTTMTTNTQANTMITLQGVAQISVSSRSPWSRRGGTSSSTSIRHLSTINSLTLSPTFSPKHPVQLTRCRSPVFQGGGHGNPSQNPRSKGSRYTSAISRSKKGRIREVSIKLVENPVPC